MVTVTVIRESPLITTGSNSYCYKRVSVIVSAEYKPSCKDTLLPLHLGIELFHLGEGDCILYKAVHNKDTLHYYKAVHNKDTLHNIIKQYT